MILIKDVLLLLLLLLLFLDFDYTLDIEYIIQV